MPNEPVGGAEIERSSRWRRGALERVGDSLQGGDDCGVELGHIRLQKRDGAA